MSERKAAFYLLGSWPNPDWRRPEMDIPLLSPVDVTELSSSLLYLDKLLADAKLALQ